MNFITPKTEIKAQVPVDQATAEKMCQDLQTILANVTPAEFTLLAKAVKNPLIKAAALAKLKEQFN